MIKAAIFDFNGTLYFDRDINIGGWELFYIDFFKTKEGAREFGEQAIKINNRSNVIKMYEMLGKSPTEEELNVYAKRKEEFYHQLAIEQNRHDLAPGVDKVLDYFVSKGIKLNVCTSSIKFNLDFYFEMTNLANWFDKDLVSYDNNKVTNKVEMYKLAASNINVDPKDCIVFEDSPKSIEDAIKAGFDKFIYVNHYDEQKLNQKEILQEIKEYSEVDYSLFE